MFLEIFEDIWEIKDTAVCLRQQLLYGQRPLIVYFQVYFYKQ